MKVICYQSCETKKSFLTENIYLLQKIWAPSQTFIVKFWIFRLSSRFIPFLVVNGWKFVFKLALQQSLEQPKDITLKKAWDMGYVLENNQRCANYWK